MLIIRAGIHKKKQRRLRRSKTTRSSLIWVCTVDRRLDLFRTLTVITAVNYKASARLLFLKKNELYICICIMQCHLGTALDSVLGQHLKQLIAEKIPIASPGSIGTWSAGMAGRLSLPSNRCFGTIPRMSLKSHRIVLVYNATTT